MMACIASQYLGKKEIEKGLVTGLGKNLTISVISMLHTNKETIFSEG
jgi:hypothetical protein